MYCKNCGEELFDGTSKFCNHCGVQLQGSPTRPQKNQINYMNQGLQEEGLPDWTHDPTTVFMGILVIIIGIVILVAIYLNSLGILYFG